jgi:hypothetical protein
MLLFSSSSILGAAQQRRLRADRQARILGISEGARKEKIMQQPVAESLFCARRMLSFFIKQDCFIVLAAVKYANDIDLLIVYIKGDGDTLSIACNTEAGANIIAPGSTGREGTEALTARHYPFGEACRDLRRCFAAIYSYSSKAALRPRE